MKECATCIFSAPTISDIEGEGPLLKCRRYPQQVIVVDGQLGQSFPDATTLCGEYKPDNTIQENPIYKLFPSLRALKLRLFKKGY